LDQVFLICALVGGGLFLVRTVLQFITGGDAGDVDGDLDVDVDGGDHHRADISFKLLSFQGLVAFTMMLGLTGLAATRQSHVSTELAMVIAAVAGFGTVWVISKVFTGMSRLQSSGTTKMSDAIGAEGIVYLTIPAAGVGKVEVTVAKRLSVFDAQAENGEAIPTGARVTVVRVVAGGTLIVQKV
jgi:membrane protein implicated in regulation of membrane protease activity